MLSFQKTQMQLAGHMRDPANCVAPTGMEARRMKIYSDLIFNNIESFLRSGFPVLRSLYKEGQWNELVRSFILEYRCQSPYFLEISREFLHFLQQHFSEPPEEKPFLLELAHYEWVELALSVSTEPSPPQPVPIENILEVTMKVSLVAWRLSYHFPVHKIGPSNQPLEAPSDLTYLVVYRDSSESVGFIETNAVSSRLLQLLEEEGSSSGNAILELIAAELGRPVESILGFGEELLQTFYQAGVIQTA